MTHTGDYVMSAQKDGSAEFGSVGKKYGQKTVTLSISEMPSHTHAQYVSANSGGSALRNDYVSDTRGFIYDQGVNTGAAGGGGAHLNIQPSISTLLVIRT